MAPYKYSLLQNYNLLYNLQYFIFCKCLIFQGYVSRFHLINASQSLEDHKEGEKISARVLYTNPVTKQTAFTLKSTFWDTKSWNVVSHGELYEGLVVEEAEVMSVVEKVGVYLKLGDDRVAFASRKNMSIPPTDNIKPHFKAGSTHSCVVIGFNDMDEIVLVSLKENLVNQPFLSYKDLHVGQVVECKVIGRVPSGVVVRIGDRIQGTAKKFFYRTYSLSCTSTRYSAE